MNSLQRLLYAAAAILLATGAAIAADDPRPNFLWLIAEDNGPEYGCYGYPLVKTPNVDRLAGDGTRYTNAFVTAPVCSASRSAFMTGMYQTTINAHNHRSHRADSYHVPAGVEVITQPFQRAGYFTTNVRTAAPGVTGSGKTDFNFEAESHFDGTDWNQREPGQPFFAQINFHETHRKYPDTRGEHLSADKVSLPPYYPDHPVAREDWAAYLGAIEELDRQIGLVLKRLDDEGLSQNTVVFFFGDNGQSHMRGKQWLYEGGIHVPLIVRIPEKFRRDGQGQPGTVCDDLVSAIDFSASCMALAGVPLPEKLQGQPFLGTAPKTRDFVVAARDRCDETVDFIRCIRTKQYKYIRNFHPERPYMQPNRYKETSYPMVNLMKELHAQGKLTPVQELFMAERRPPEELYDLSADPHEIQNLAASPEHQEVLADLRAKLEQWMIETNDQGRIAESAESLSRERRWADEQGGNEPRGPGTSERTALLLFSRPKSIPRHLARSPGDRAAPDPQCCRKRKAPIACANQSGFCCWALPCSALMSRFSPIRQIPSEPNRT
ncbi:MAG: sulfatase family protein [Thermoguttaceae bacterium]